MISVSVDASEFKRLARNLSRLATKTEDKILVRATNTAGQQGRTAIRQSVRNASGMKATYVNRRVTTAKRANASDVSHKTMILGAKTPLHSSVYGNLRHGPSTGGVKHKAKLVENPVYGFTKRHNSKRSVNGGGIALRRVGEKRKPLEPIQTPGPVEVFQQHGGVQAWKSKVRSVWPREVARLIKREFGKLRG